MTREQLETYLQSQLFPDLEQGRPGFDLPHTQTVVYYLKQIFKHTPGLEVDKTVVLIAAYCHDWGYTHLFDQKVATQMDEVVKQKKAHAIIGAQKTKELLTKPFFDFLSDVQKSRIIHLVAVHDSLSDIKDIDERVLVEADTLGSLDTDQVQPTFDAASNQRFMAGVLKKRFPLFVTEYAKKTGQALIQKRDTFYKES